MDVSATVAADDQRLIDWESNAFIVPNQSEECVHVTFVSCEQAFAEWRGICGLAPHPNGYVRFPIAGAAT